MNKFSFLKVFLFAILTVFIAVSCDDEYDQLGSDVVDGDIHNSIHSYNGSIVAYDRATGAVQTSGLDINLLGVYDHPVFGKTTASYVTQLQMVASPTFDVASAVIDSVWLYIPFNSDLESSEVNDDGETESKYTLNNVYGDSIAGFKIKVRKNNFYLRSTDPSTGGTGAQYYYNDQLETTFESQQGESLLVNNAVYDTITYSHDEIVRTATFIDDEDAVQPVTAERLPPGIFMYLNKEIFKQYFINAPSGKLMNNNVFTEYFRGISITTEQIGSNSVIGIPKFTSGYIKVKYTQNDLNSSGAIQYEDDGTTVKKESLTLTLNMTGMHVNLLKTQQTPAYLAAVGTSDTALGDEKLYIKGGEGSMALIDIMSEADIAALNADSVLVNEASLKFYVDEAAMGGAEIPKRLYLYDINNKRPLLDYYADQTTLTNTFYNKYVHDGILNKDAAGQYYRIRITNHVSNLINKDSTNVKLGLVVTEDINTNVNAVIRTPFTENSAEGEVTIKTTPAASVMFPFGVVLYGTGPTVPANKRAKLEIYYTKKD